ncbi:MAG TPA: site-specific integrase [Gemmata sp.]|jgi:integrase|nr:site-specific integrase [Gemmata sp.]
MGRVYHAYYTRPRKDGEAGIERVYSKKWSIEYQSAGGKTIHKTIGMDRRAAQSALRRFEDREAMLRNGLSDPKEDGLARRRPLAELIPEYLAILEAFDREANYRKGVKKHLELLMNECKWHTWSDVNSDSLILFLGKLRATPCKRPHQHTPDKGRSPATLNGYIRSAKGFCNWYSKKLKGDSPLRDLQPFNEQVDLRRSRRILNDDELLQLLAATEAAPRRHNCKVKPRDRSALYRIAAYTGLRASELASLTPNHFQLDHLDRVPPVVIVEAKDAKGRREEPIPLPPHLVEFLRTFLAGRKPNEKIWPGEWARYHHQATWLKRDCKRAKLGDGVTFHGLKRRYVTRLVRSGVEIDLVRRLARHKQLSTTMNYYVGSDLPELAAAVNKLPPPGAAQESAGTV